MLMALAVDSVADSTEGPPATEAKEEPGFTTRRRKRRRGGRRGEGKEAGASWCCERRSWSGEGPGDASEEEVVDTADNAREIRQRGRGGNKQALLLLAWCCERLFVLLPAPWSARAPSPSRSPSASRSDLRVWCGRGVAFAGSFFAGSFFAGAAWPFAAADGHGAEIGRCRWRGRTWSRRTWWSSLVIQGVGGVKENPLVRAGSTSEYRSPSSRTDL